MRWFDIEPCYFYHPLNAYDLDDGRVVLDAVRHPKMFDQNRPGPNEGPPRLDRWTIDPAEGKVLEETLDDRPQEFPRLNETLQGQRNRYGYGVTTRPPSTPRRHRRSSTTWWPARPMEHDYGPGRDDARAGVRAPRRARPPRTTAGCMSYVYDATTDRSDVVILDAQDFTGDPVATIHLPVRVPVRLPRQLGPHGR